MSEADRIIERLDLAPHPEGGWFKETWRAPIASGQRASSTAILFLLKAGECSHWHRVDAAEIWLWHAGDPLMLSMCESDEGPAERIELGPPSTATRLLQAVVPPYWWQAAELAGGGQEGYTLVSCVVAPGFEFAGFELAPPDWKPGKGGQASEMHQHERKL
ncbi:cupin domain-containing protein [Tsuneonella mangrovi]|uniref:cupin domain-containing protein n=1 Tax=Tsuneonella mangrovi TaxID=1982042 RepID=UPI000BA224D6|nr:cupin domain-containing protein [Tsuneonella mangrovi]